MRADRVACSELKQFYRELMGWDVAAIPEYDYQVLLGRGRLVAGYWEPGGEFADRLWAVTQKGWRVYFATDDPGRSIAMAL